jgi:PIN domain nuclease of toxin-antitoxin system
MSPLLTPAPGATSKALPASISDPTDGLIVSTAQALGVPLVTKDGRITAARVVEVIW